MAPSETTESEMEPLAGDAVRRTSFGPHAKVKILVVLISNSDRDLNPTEISGMAGIDRSTFSEHADDRLAYGMIEQARTVGNSPMYRINRDSAAAEAPAQMEWDYSIRSRSSRLARPPRPVPGVPRRTVADPSPSVAVRRGGRTTYYYT